VSGVCDREGHCCRGAETDVDRGSGWRRHRNRWGPGSRLLHWLAGRAQGLFTIVGETEVDGDRGHLGRQDAGGRVDRWVEEDRCMGTSGRAATSRVWGTGGSSRSERDDTGVSERVGAGPGAGAQLGLSSLTSINPPRANKSYLNFCRSYHLPIEVKINFVSLPQPMKITVLPSAFNLSDGI
jgi:hypothetical protein